MTTVEEIAFLDVGTHRLAATVVSKRERLPAALFIHGWAGNQSQYLTRAHQIAGLGAVCLTFDLTGHETTHSQWTTVSRAANFRDVLAAYDLLAARPCPLFAAMVAAAAAQVTAIRLIRDMR